MSTRPQEFHGPSRAARTARAVAAGVAVLAVTGSAALTVASAQDSGRSSAGSPAGLWRVDGYGTVLAVGEKRVQEYQTTGVSCLEGPAARRTGGHGRSARYATGDGTSFTLRSRAGSAHRATMRWEQSPGHRELRRIESLPERCDRSVPKGPVATFDVFWQTFAENYPFFAAKGVDWEEVRDRYRPRVHAGTSRAQLFEIFRKMAAPLYDAHVAVLAGETGTFGRVRPGTEAPTPELDATVRTFVERRDLKDGTLREFGKGRIGYADLPDGQGYLRLSGFVGYTGGDYASQRAELRRALGAVFTAERTRRLTGLIVDLRVNGGGSDSLALELAGRLTGRPYFAYAKAARNDPSDPERFTRPQPVHVRPAAGAPRYTGPVAVLTGGSTVSAGETFTQALMERPDRTVRIGQPTQGVFSDTLERRLPNGWSVMLPNEEFRTRHGRTFDGTGIPPHLTEPVFTDEEFAHDRDSAFDRARRELTAARERGGRS
ncbi:S41 family peptidase [Streptomyces nanshensis]|uniref:S41 family peptidase n=1 Tax=Streptomyces nanshensis TaxID=518642 RepID=UPI0009A08FC3|nr:S41 family peptidase [Streptomyces nanshensis]